MKKIVIFVVLFILEISNIMAQDEVKNSHKPFYTVTFGYNRSKLLSSSFSDYYDWKSGVNFGANVSFPLTKTFGLRSGVYFQQKGYLDAQSVSQNKYRFDYMEVPVLALFNVHFCKDLSIEFQTGIYFAYGVYGSDVWGYTIHDANNQEIYIEECIFDMYDKYDWGLNAGIAFRFKNYFIGSSVDFGVPSIVNDAHHLCLMGNVGFCF